MRTPQGSKSLKVERDSGWAQMLKPLFSGTVRLKAHPTTIFEERPKNPPFLQDAMAEAMAGVLRSVEQERAHLLAMARAAAEELAHEMHKVSPAKPMFPGKHGR